MGEARFVKGAWWCKDCQAFTSNPRTLVIESDNTVIPKIEKRRYVYDSLGDPGMCGRCQSSNGLMEELK